MFPMFLCGQIKNEPLRRREHGGFQEYYLVYYVPYVPIPKFGTSCGQIKNEPLRRREHGEITMRPFSKIRLTPSMFPLC
jgi:hypothetical protein